MLDVVEQQLLRQDHPQCPASPPAESSPRMQEALPSAENHSKHYTGSSPQMRGAPSHIYFARTGQRIIPADAGSTG